MTNLLCEMSNPIPGLPFSRFILTAPRTGSSLPGSLLSALFGHFIPTQNEKQLEQGK